MTTDSTITNSTFSNYTQAEQNAITYSDTFKEVNGFRPRGRLMDRFLAKTLEEQDRAIEDLYEE